MPVAKSAGDASIRSSTYKDRGPFLPYAEIHQEGSSGFGIEGKTYYRVQSIIFVVVLTQIAAAVILVLRLLYRGLILVEKEKVWKGMRRPTTAVGGHVRGRAEDGSRAGDAVKTNRAVEQSDEQTPPSVPGVKWRTLCLLLRPPKGDELQAFCPFLASFFAQSAVR